MEEIKTRGIQGTAIIDVVNAIKNSGIPAADPFAYACMPEKITMAMINDRYFFILSPLKRFYFYTFLN